jgi:hypothetical protein
LVCNERVGLSLEAGEPPTARARPKGKRVICCRYWGAYRGCDLGIVNTSPADS